MCDILFGFQFKQVNIFGENISETTGEIWILDGIKEILINSAKYNNLWWLHIFKMPLSIRYL